MLDLESAIQHCEEVANGMTAQGKCPECAADHRQLAEWLKELKTYREQKDNIISRQAVIDLLNAKVEKWMKDKTEPFILFSDIMALPSVTL